MSPSRAYRPTATQLARALCLAGGALAQAVSAQLGTHAPQSWNEGSPGLTSSLQEEVHFGAAVASGDFDCDGIDDLAIGVPEDDDEGGAVLDVGYVMVLYGSHSGLVAAGHDLWDQQELAAESEEELDHFGEVLGAGDFDDDGCDDLVIGMPSEGIGSASNAGGLQVIYGAAGGLTEVGNEFFRQGDGAIGSAPEANDNFGASLAVGDFDADGVDDLAVGVPGEDIEAAGVSDAGAVHVLFGSAGVGLTGTGDLVFYRGNGVDGVPQEDERIGFALAAGQFNSFTAWHELAIGAPYSSSPGHTSDGRVILLLNPGTVGNSVEFTQSGGAPGESENNDLFGWTLATGDFNGDGDDELAVGTPFENLEEWVSATDAGAITVLDVEEVTGYQRLTQGEFFMLPEDGDRLGIALTAGDFNADGADDLAIGVPFEDLGTGLVHVLHGAMGAGLDPATETHWFQTVGTDQPGDYFGYALAAGRFAGHSGFDLAVGVPYETFVGFSDAGVVNIVFSDALFADGFESGDTAIWSGTLD